ncbi:hypothetical protein [Bradyrhizobium elkanii]|uniref:hypothetical protein n=1 Tax=Bradyrhizobium elkanii TaxID=29448 RepID=UPI00272A3F58|nr:hypothetical protein [Bradyrhizobium elkanii]WLA80286.1 hypothetical protein QNJ99_33610 [Bradyrhizobium elkanii]
MARNLTVRESEEWAEVVITYLEANGYPFNRNTQSLPAYLASSLADLSGSPATIYSDSLPDIIIRLAAHFTGLNLNNRNCDFTDALALLNSYLGSNRVDDGGGGGPYHASAVHFDGTAQLHLDSLLATDSRYVGVVLWQKYARADITTQGTVWVIDPVNDYNTFYEPDIQGLTSPDNVQVFVGFWDYGANNGIKVGATSDGSTLIPDVWNCIIIAADTQAGIIKVYNRDIDITPPTLANFTPSVTGFNGHPFYFGGDASVGIIGDVAEFRLMVGANLLTAGDISEATRRLFVDASGKPVDPSTATASLGAPTVLFSGDASTFAVNQGAGGAFTLAGTLTNATTSPSD